MATLQPPYRILSRYYEKLFTPHARAFRKMRKRALGRLMPNVHSACDLCCGIAATAMELSRTSRTVFAVDDSPDMCRRARALVRRAKAPVQVLQADMRSFRLPRAVDLILAEFDAINHLPRRDDLARVARAVARALHPGGYFYFDVNTRRALQELWPRCWFTETADGVLVSHGRYDKRTDTGSSELEWFLPVGKTRYRRFTERYREVCWEDGEIKRTLRNAGFAAVKSWDCSELVSGVAWLAPGYRRVYLARKAK